jgi:hypothetical protein
MGERPGILAWLANIEDFFRRDQGEVSGGWRAGLLLNMAIRAHVVYFLGETLLLPDDARFAGKAIPGRNLIIVGGLSLLIPALYFWRKKWERYPFWLDNLYLSIFWLDMAGNSFNLYDRFYYFDLIPHFHGTGVSAIVLRGIFGLSGLSAVGSANLIHTLLEAQEHYTDVFSGTHNVRGVSDVINDLVVGILATAIYIPTLILFKKKRKNKE